MRFHHLGIIAETREIGKRHLDNLFGPLNWTTPVVDQIQQVEVLFAVDSSGIRFELIIPFGEKTPISASLRSRKNILNHIAYTAADLDSEDARLREHGCVACGIAQPAQAFAGRRIQFHMSPLGFIIELIEAEQA